MLDGLDLVKSLPESLMERWQELSGMSTIELAKYRYLIVDDDQVTCDLITSLLRKIGVAQMTVATGGKAAVEAIKTEELPDIIICDLNMPEFNGIEFLCYLAEAAFNGGIVLISASDTVIMRAALKLGNARALDMIGILPKPFTPDDLIKSISQYDKNSRLSFI